jgi:hypothetical protein
VGGRSFHEPVLRAGADRVGGALPDGLRNGASAVGGGPRRPVRRSNGKPLRRRRLRHAVLARRVSGCCGVRRLG